MITYGQASLPPVVGTEAFLIDPAHLGALVPHDSAALARGRWSPSASIQQTDGGRVLERMLPQVHQRTRSDRAGRPDPIWCVPDDRRTPMRSLSPIARMSPTVLMLSMTACSTESPPPAVAVPAEAPRELVVVAQANVHGDIEPCG